MQKSVVIIGPAFPLRGGLSSYNERLTREFTSIGFQSSIYTFSLQYPSFLFPGTTQYSTEPKPADLDIHVKINSINPLNWIKVGLELKKRCPDIIVVRYWLPFMGPCLGTILRIVKSNKKTQIVCIADNIIPHEKRPGDSLFTSYFIKPIDAFITMSEKVLKDLSVLTTKKAIHVIHPLYDNFGESIDKTEAKEHLDILPSTPIVLFFGFIRKYKGLDLLLEAIHILNQRKYFEQNPIQFLIAGEFYDDSKPYTDLIDQYNISKFIILKNEFIADSVPESLAIVIGNPDVSQPVLTRIHSSCFTGDLIGSLRCDCGDQLRGAIRAMAAHGSGVLIYLPQEGRGIGLVNKLRAYALQDAGFDTIDANTQLGFESEERRYIAAGEILHRLKITRIRLLTNNPGKRAALDEIGVEVVERVPLVVSANRHSEAYLNTKVVRDGHEL